jgi:hypothetical protein
MHPSLKRDIAPWEAEGGAASNRSGIPAVRLTGTAVQVEWAERIKRRVNDRFDRVAASFRLVAEREIEDKRAETEEIIAILEDKRAEVMSRQDAGYFIYDWQEIGDRVGKMIVRDPCYRAIRCNRDARRLGATGSTFRLENSRSDPGDTDGSAERSVYRFSHAHDRATVCEMVEKTDDTER